MRSDTDAFLSDVHGLIHVGANTGQERDTYHAHDLDVLWVEPLPDVFQTLKRNLAEFPRQKACQALVTDKDDEEQKFHRASNAGASSSILRLDRHRQLWPEVTYETSLLLKSTTLATLIAREHLDVALYDALVIDAQGAELLVLKGAEAVLRRFKYIKVELPDFESYSGCAQVSDVESFLALHGFHEHSRKAFAGNADVGHYFDIVYKNDGHDCERRSTLRVYPRSCPRRDSAGLHRFKKDVTSQCGEDGIIEHIFGAVLGASNKWCVEFGAWDGKRHSTSWNLIANHGWKALLIEGNPVKFLDLVETHGSNKTVIPVNAYVAVRPGPDSLDSILAEHDIPADLDYLSIGIDGCDWHVWEGLARYRPRLLVIGFNPTIPNHVFFVQARDSRVNQGSSLRALIELGKRKGYELVVTTPWNAFFVRREDFSRFGIEDNSIDSMHSPDEYESVLFQLFDGTLVLGGCDRLLWHDIAVTSNDIQVLPESLRRLDDAARAGGSTETRLAHLQILRMALARHHADHGAYPVSTGFDGVHTNWGAAGPTWIRGLVPAYLRALPRDPAHSEQGDKQYLYRSDGKDYKLICHGPEDLQQVAQARPELLDPARATWAYGYWTEGAANW